MAQGAVLVEELEGGVRLLTLHNPQRRNALDEYLLDALADALAPERAKGVRALLIRGHGEAAFCAGFDIGAIDRCVRSGLPPDVRIQRTLALLESHPAPSVALLQGATFGAGCELAAACDLRVAADDAVLCMPPARLGVVYAAEGIARLLRLGHPSKVRWMMLTGRRVSARDALDAGLLDEVHPVVEAEAAALALAEELATNAPLAIQGMRATFSALQRVDLTTEEASELGRLRRQAYESDDAREAQEAFKERRRPRFHGR